MDCSKRMTAKGWVVCAVFAAPALACSGSDREMSSLRQHARTLDECYEQELDWRDCEDGFECAELQVPFDYAKPEGRQFVLPLIRKLATTSRGLLGSLVLNPGGPGGSGIQHLRSGAARYTLLNERYNLVSFDPRGVGGSQPAVDCGLAQDELEEADQSPDDDEEVALLMAGLHARAEACEAHSDGILPFVGTVNAAKDMDVLRAALGDEKLSYLGFSYGTFLGAAYAHQFPERVGRLVLDGTLPPGLSFYQRTLDQARGFELAFQNFADACAARADCPLGDVGQEIVLKTIELSEALDKEPMPADPEPLTQNQLHAVLGQALYGKARWPTLEAALSAAFAGDGTPFQRFRQELEARETGNLNEALVAITCADTTERPEFVQAVAASPVFETLAPLFASHFLGMLMCSGWSFAGSDEVQDVSAPGAPPILTVGTTGDPATPVNWTPPLADALGTGVLLYNEGEGHCAYGNGNPCTDGKIEDFLLHGQLPMSGELCEAANADGDALLAAAR